MKAVDQTIFHNPEQGEYGNCLSACVASLLELSIEEVPNFGAMPDNAWGLEYVLFLQRHGCEYQGQKDIAQSEPFPQDLGTGIGGLFIAGGPSPRGAFGHAVIVDAVGNLVHDPHPSRAGVLWFEDVDLIERVIDDSGNERGEL